MIVVSRSLLRTKRKIRKDTKPLRHKSGYQKYRKSYPQKTTTHGEQHNKVGIANKAKAQSEAAVKEHIKNFPEVKVEHIIDGDTVIVVTGHTYAIPVTAKTVTGKALFVSE